MNDREDELLLEVDKIYDSSFFNEDIIKDNKKFKNKVIKSLEEGEKMDKEWENENNLILLINNCINIENNIKDITEINEAIKKCNLNQNINYVFIPNENDKINEFLEKIKKFGKFENDSLKSKIISVNDYFKIDNWLKESIGNIKKYELIYRATEQGDSKAVSFKICKNVPNLLWIMIDKNNNIFGCFHSISINSSNIHSKDPKCFLYSINKNKKYLPNLNLQNNIGHCSNHVLEFEDKKREFSIGDKFLSSNSVYFQNGNIFNHNLEICNEAKVTLKELEVFKIIQ